MWFEPDFYLPSLSTYLKIYIILLQNTIFFKKKKNTHARFKNRLLEDAQKLRGQLGSVYVFFFRCKSTNIAAYNLAYSR